MAEAPGDRVATQRRLGTLWRGLAGAGAGALAFIAFGQVYAWFGGT
jgi:hypothetical protein